MVWSVRFEESYAKHFYEESHHQLQGGIYNVTNLSIIIDVTIREGGLVTPVV